MATIRVPTRMSALTLYGLMAAAIDDQKNPRDEEIEFDFQGVGFVDAGGVVMISNFLEWLKKRGVRVTFKNCDPERPAIRYLDDAEFFDVHLGAPLQARARVRSTMYPFRRLHCSRSHQWIDGDLFPWVANAVAEAALPPMSASRHQKRSFC